MDSSDTGSGIPPTNPQPKHPHGPATPPQAEADGGGSRRVQAGAHAPPGAAPLGSHPSAAALRPGGQPAGGGASSPAAQSKAPPVGSGQIREGDPQRDPDLRARARGDR